MVMLGAGWGQGLKLPERLGPQRLPLSAACTQHSRSVEEEGPLCFPGESRVRGWTKWEERGRAKL